MWVFQMSTGACIRRGAQCAGHNVSQWHNVTSGQIQCLRKPRMPVLYVLVADTVAAQSGTPAQNQGGRLREVEDLTMRGIPTTKQKKPNASSSNY